jgi:hypothetical protein
MPEGCPALVDDLVPAAVPVLGGYLIENAEALCADVAGTC